MQHLIQQFNHQQHLIQQVNHHHIPSPPTPSTYVTFAVFGFNTGAAKTINCHLGCYLSTQFVVYLQTIEVGCQWKARSLFDSCLLSIPTLRKFFVRYCWVKVWQLETGCPVEENFKLWVVETNWVNPWAHVVANLVSKTRPQNRQNLENILGKLGFSFS